MSKFESSHHNFLTTPHLLRFRIFQQAILNLIHPVLGLLCLIFSIAPRLLRFLFVQQAVLSLIHPDLFAPLHQTTPILIHSEALILLSALGLILCHRRTLSSPRPVNAVRSRTPKPPLELLLSPLLLPQVPLRSVDLNRNTLLPSNTLRCGKPNILLTWRADF